ncbi:4-hydroxy-tetrahydrodipicolinate reductase [Leuconostoc carnosum]|uniref:4-hydroxy-tetrahydrodipicolinate reductase n=1 Tax=Leuconostoc carnosum TaxID=1252 RepID=UPI001238F4B3|nr:4-hydroxy-tetrahydrodipicolinate reductase [Leuconostoc carnosum]KAA8362384.1 4-hydroxy-tetrahydrodipicolinate reductase [Leuconostoc carnosum]KAA8366933.1 4-hydroxy-tetrahydrodipicolinate reductase [Leuconostoc carnosum]
MTKIILAGGFGKLGQAIQNGLVNTDYEIVGILSGKNHESDFPVWTSVEDITVSADIFLDVSTPASVYDNALWAIKNNMAVVIGATGLQDDQIKSLQNLVTKGVLIVPNFSLSAVLLMQFSQLAAKYFADVEIVEAHNPKKVDSPSGTAVQTAKLIAESRVDAPQQTQVGQARGQQIDDVPVHAMRLPGYIAQQTVYFGGTDEQLTLSQSTTSRSAFVPGVLLALDGVKKIDGLVIGLDHVL